MSRLLRCSFCNKSEEEVKKLVAGPNVYICDACVKIATDIMESDGPHAPAAQRKARGLFQRVWRRFFGNAQKRVAAALS